MLEYEGTYKNGHPDLGFKITETGKRMRFELQVLVDQRDAKATKADGQQIDVITR